MADIGFSHTIFGLSNRPVSGEIRGDDRHIPFSPHDRARDTAFSVRKTRDNKVPSAAITMLTMRMLSGPPVPPLLLGRRAGAFLTLQYSPSGLTRTCASRSRPHHLQEHLSQDFHGASPYPHAVRNKGTWRPCPVCACHVALSAGNSCVGTGIAITRISIKIAYWLACGCPG